MAREDGWESLTPSTLSDDELIAEVIFFSFSSSDDDKKSAAVCSVEVISITKREQVETLLAANQERIGRSLLLLHLLGRLCCLGPGVTAGEQEVWESPHAGPMPYR